MHNQLLLNQRTKISCSLICRFYDEEIEGSLVVCDVLTGFLSLSSFLSFFSLYSLLILLLACFSIIISSSLLLCPFLSNSAKLLNTLVIVHFELEHLVFHVLLLLHVASLHFLVLFDLFISLAFHLVLFPLDLGETLHIFLFLLFNFPVFADFASIKLILFILKIHVMDLFFTFDLFLRFYQLLVDFLEVLGLFLSLLVHLITHVLVELISMLIHKCPKLILFFVLEFLAAFSERSRLLLQVHLLLGDVPCHFYLSIIKQQYKIEVNYQYCFYERSSELLFIPTLPPRYSNYSVSFAFVFDLARGKDTIGSILNWFFSNFMSFYFQVWRDFYLSVMWLGTSYEFLRICLQTLFIFSIFSLNLRFQSSILSLSMDFTVFLCSWLPRTAFSYCCRILFEWLVIVLFMSQLLCSLLEISSLYLKIYELILIFLCSLDMQNC